MNFGDFENGCSASNFFSIVHIDLKEVFKNLRECTFSSQIFKNYMDSWIQRYSRIIQFLSTNHENYIYIISRRRENRFSQDTQHRPRRLPFKKLKATRTSASLVIDQLKNDFRCPDDFTSRMRTRRNWRPEFLIKYLRDNQRDCNEECTMTVHSSLHHRRSFVPEMPKICSIGLYSSMQSLINSNDPSSLFGTTKNFKRHFDIVLRSMFICEYWVEKSIPTSSSTLTSIGALLKTQKNQQIAIIDCKESANISKYDQIQKSNYNQSVEQIKEKNSDIFDSSRGDYAAGDRSFISNDFKDSPVSKECRSCMTRDAQIQTSGRRSLRRKKTKKRLKQADKGISHNKHHANERRGKIIADFRGDSDNSNKKNCYDKSRLSVQVLESKHADYINKFTAVNRQIEEITATLRETCYDDNSRSNLEICEEYFSSVSDNAKVNINRESNDVENKSTTRKRNKRTKRKNILKGNVRRIIRESESDRRKNILEVDNILHVDNINDELLDRSSREYSRDSLTPAIKLKDIFVRDSTRTFSIDRTVHSLTRNFSNEKKGKCRFVKQISFDLNLPKNDDKVQEISIEAETFDKVHIKNNIVPSYDKHVKDLIEDCTGLEGSGYRKKIVGENVGEMAILEDIKKRIDRDIDDRSSEKDDMEDFLTVSQKNSNFDRLFYEITSTEDSESVRTIENSKSTSLIVSGSPNLDLTEIQIRGSISTEAVSERSNKNSTLSEYFSCMQFPSMVSFAENDDETALSFKNRDVTAHDSNSFSSYNYYDYSRSNLNINSFTRSDLDANFDCSYSNSECVAEYISPNKFPIETRNATTDMFELSEDQASFVENKICERFLGESKKKEKESHVEFAKRYTADSTFETSKSSRYIGSIDSGVFSSSLIDLYPYENSADKSGLKKKRRVEKLDGSSPLIVDFNSDSSCTDDTLDQRVNDVVRDLTEKLILCERKMKLKKMRKMGCKARDARYYSRQTLSRRTCKLTRSLYDAYYDLFNSPRRSSENERILSISTPTLLSLSDSEIENRNELRC